MAKVTIEGVVSTSALRRGDVVEVERTERVDRLVDAGYVKVLTKTEAKAAGPVEETVLAEPAADTSTAESGSKTRASGRTRKNDAESTGNTTSDE